MRIAVALAGFALAICAITRADAIQSASVAGRDMPVSTRLELSHELRPFPRPPIIVNAASPALPEQHPASTKKQPAARGACSVKLSQESAAACGELPKVPQPR